MVAQTQISLPTELVDQLTDAAASMGLTLAAYLVFLEQCHVGRLDLSAQDATRFMLRTQSESLRKLAQ